MSLIKFLLAVPMCLICFSTTASGELRFELPRTKVLAMQDSNTKRFYELHIQLPNRYTKDKKYPVVYMTDSLYTFPIMVGAARFLTNFGRMENVMFVGISQERNHPPALSRQRDYTPTDRSPEFGDPSGQADKHLEFIRTDVINYIEENYSTDPTRRTYVGNSFGGLFGAYIFLTKPETFRNYILGSPSIWWDNKYILELEAQSDKLSSAVNASVFIAVGANETPPKTGAKYDMVGDAKALYNQLKARKLINLSLKLKVIDSAYHETAFPTTAIQGLWWLFKTNKK